MFHLCEEAPEVNADNISRILFSIGIVVETIEDLGNGDVIIDRGPDQFTVGSIDALRQYVEGRLHVGSRS